MSRAGQTQRLKGVLAASLGHGRCHRARAELGHGVHRPNLGYLLPSNRKIQESQIVFASELENTGTRKHWKSQLLL